MCEDGFIYLLSDCIRMYEFTPESQEDCESISGHKRAYGGIRLTEPLSGRCVFPETVAESIGWVSLKEGNIVCLKTQPDFFTDDTNGSIHPIPFYVSEVDLSSDEGFYGVTVSLVKFGTGEEIYLSGKEGMSPRDSESGEVIDKYSLFTDIGLVSDIVLADWFDIIDIAGLYAME